MSNQTTSTLGKLPGVLAFSRGHIVTDGEMFNEINGQFESYPVDVVRHGIRGTQNVSDNHDKRDTATNGDRGVANIQLTETAKLDARADALIVRFGFSMIDIADGLHSCLSAEKEYGKIMRATFKHFVERAKDSEGIVEIARRYARNIANGRWLWRNRTIARAINIKVSNSKGILGSFDAKSIPLNKFDQYNEGEIKVAKELVEQMCGHSLDGLTITARLTMPIKGAIEVFPSQNYIDQKPVGFARSLYKLGHSEKLERVGRDELRDVRVMGRAALRDQKIFNAIRTIDTWYPAFDEMQIPIVVEPMGASLSQQEFYRKNLTSSFYFFKRLDQIDPNTPDGMFCIAALDRGGVYSESDKKAKP